MFFPEFFYCDTCGNLIWIINNSSVPVECCGEAMTELSPGTSDGAHEKHVPVVTEQDGMLHVQVGSVLHPATVAHHIEWIALQTDTGMFFKEVQLGKEPVADFCGLAGKPVAVFAYCNLHGLWEYEL